MTLQHYFQLLRNRWHVIVVVTLAIFVLVTIVTLAQPQRYRSTVNLLIVQRYSWNMDAYNAARSTQYLATILSQVIYSQSFFDQVMQSGYGISYVFSHRPEKRRVEWEAMVKTHSTDQTGVMTIDVYHTDRDQADRLARAIEYVFTTKGDQYHGGGNQVTLKTIDAPYTSEFPVQPNVPLNLVAGLVLGLFLACALVALFPSFTFAMGDVAPVFPVLGALAQDERGSIQFGAYPETKNKAVLPDTVVSFAPTDDGVVPSTIDVVHDYGQPTHVEESQE